MVDTPHSNPLSVYAHGGRLRAGDASDAVGGILVEIDAENGTIGYATGIGGAPACCIIERHLKRFLINRAIDDTVALWDLMYRASLPYGRNRCQSLMGCCPNQVLISSSLKLNL